MTDEELVDHFREIKDDTAGQDPALTPSPDNPEIAVREELTRRGLAPDREEVVPPTDPTGDSKAVDRA